MCVIICQSQESFQTPPVTVTSALPPLSLLLRRLGSVRLPPVVLGIHTCALPRNQGATRCVVVVAVSRAPSCLTCSLRAFRPAVAAISMTLLPSGGSFSAVQVACEPAWLTSRAVGAIGAAAEVDCIINASCLHLLFIYLFIYVF